MAAADERAGRVVEARALRALSARSDGRGLGHLASHLLALGVAGYALGASLGTGWVVPATVVYAILLTFLFAPAHECIHRTAFRGRWLNDTVAWLAGLVLLLPSGYFRAYHLAHHWYTQDPTRDPELAVPKPRDLRDYAVWVSGVGYWWRQGALVLRHAAGRVAEPTIPTSGHRAAVRQARLYLACYGAIGGAAAALGSWAPLTYGVVPLVVGQPFLRLFLLSEHIGCSETGDMLANTRTTLTNPIVRWLVWNMSYHVEHHLHPGVPCHALPALHALLDGRHERLAGGYAAFHWALARRLSGRDGRRTATPALPL